MRHSIPEMTKNKTDVGIVCSKIYKKINEQTPVFTISQY